MKRDFSRGHELDVELESWMDRLALEGGPHPRPGSYRHVRESVGSKVWGHALSCCIRFAAKTIKLWPLRKCLAPCAISRE